MRKMPRFSHPALVQSLIRAFAQHWYIILYLMILLADNKGRDQTVWMRRLIWAFAVRIRSETLFLMARPGNNPVIC